MQDGFLAETGEEELTGEILHPSKENEALKKKLGEKEEADLREKLLKLRRFEPRVKRPKTPGQKVGY